MNRVFRITSNDNTLNRCRDGRDWLVRRQLGRRCDLTIKFHTTAPMMMKLHTGLCLSEWGCGSGVQRQDLLTELQPRASTGSLFGGDDPFRKLVMIDNIDLAACWGGGVSSYQGVPQDLTPTSTSLFTPLGCYMYFSADRIQKYTLFTVAQQDGEKAALRPEQHIVFLLRWWATF